MRKMVRRADGTMNDVLVSVILRDKLNAMVGIDSQNVASAKGAMRPTKMIVGENVPINLANTQMSNVTVNFVKAGMLLRSENRDQWLVRLLAVVDLPVVRKKERVAGRENVKKTRSLLGWTTTFLNLELPSWEYSVAKSKEWMMKYKLGRKSKQDPKGPLPNLLQCLQRNLQLPVIPYSAILPLLPLRHPPKRHLRSMRSKPMPSFSDL